MKAVESEGASVQEAVDRALLLLGMRAEDAEVVVLREPGAGALEPARVRVQAKATSGQQGTSEKDVEPAKVASEQPRPAKKSVSATRKAPAQVSQETTEPVDLHLEGGADEDPLTEEEGERADRAGDLLEDLFELLDVDCYVEVAADRVDGKILIDIGGPDTATIIGRKGAVLDAIELVVNRAMDNADGGGTRVTLDAASYRARREEKLRQVAQDQSSRVSRTLKSVSLEPMSPRERRIIHMELRSNPKVTTRSEGEGPDRHVIIELAGESGRK